MRKRPSTNIMTKPIGFAPDEADNLLSKNGSNEELKFIEWMNNTYTIVDKLEGSSMILTSDIADLAEINGFTFHKHQINKMLMENSVQKFDISGEVDKIWLLQENLKTQ